MLFFLLFLLGLNRFLDNNYMSKMIIWDMLKLLKLKKKRGGPILEEILLIGIAVFIFALIFGVILGLVDWASTSLGDLFP